MSLSSSDVLAPGASGLSRKWLLAGILGAVVLLFIGLSTSSAVPFRNDFAAYWPVGRLLLTGQNPYDAGAITCGSSSRLLLSGSAPCGCGV
jgi:hypothetical protein